MIKIENLSKAYDKTLFDHFNLEISTSKITCILGASGVGKTTLLNCIARLTSFQGKIQVDGKISYIFQEPRLIPNLTVQENLKFTSPNVSDEEVTQMLSQLDIIDKKDSFPRQLSGGEAQRVSIARAFLYGAPNILMDEPFSSLDLSLKYKLITYFSTLWNTTHPTVVFVTHNIDEALLLANDIYLLKEGILSKKYHIDSGLPRSLTEQDELRKIILNDIIEIE